MTRFLLLLGILLTSAGCASFASGHGDLLSSRRAFVHHQADADYSAMAPMIETFDEPPAWRDSVIQSYTAYLSALRNSGETLLEERVDRVETLADGLRHVAFMRVVQRWTHPMYSTPRESRRTVLAFSRDDGVTWQFNVLDCINTEDVRRFIPKYSGVPAMDIESEDLRSDEVTRP